MEDSSGRLSRSSRRALELAWAAAQIRTGREPAEAEVDSWDLLVGILLSHPGYSEAESAFRHFGLVAGQLLPDQYPHLTIEELNQRLFLMGQGQSPPLSKDADEIVGAATSLGITASKSGIAELRNLWVAMLESSSEVSLRIRGLLLQRGVDASELASRTRIWIEDGGQGQYEGVLEGLRPQPADIINYKADQATRDGRDDQPANDLVGIGAEVDAFSYLIASRDLEPPLAIGLFGDWGSGKSYFLNAIQRRIDRLIESEDIRSSPQRDTPFWKRIVQVEFNAWHYVDGDLWSSLVDHIFTQLNLASESVTDNAVEARQRYYLRKMETTSEQLKSLESTKTTVRKALDDFENRIDALERHRDQALAELKEARDEEIVALQVQASRDVVVDALRATRIQDAPERLTLGEALDVLASAREEIERGRALLRPIATDRWMALKLVSVTVIGTLILAGLEMLTSAGAAVAFAGLTSLLAIIVKLLQSSTQWVTERLDRIDAARQAVNQELESAQKHWQERIAVAEHLLRGKSDQLEELKIQQAKLNAKLGIIEEELSKRPSELLYDFLKERLEAGEYRKRLGVPAIIRRDFKGLADFVSHQNAYLLAPDEQREQMRTETKVEVLDEHDSRVINRIVLYIDDLDRCPDAKVIEVLQAVHLLLAFKLFVVVVAVDSRWMAHALQSRFPVLAGAGSKKWTRCCPTR